jgi:peptidoglycan/xylan/chitin deacetylase (PgdA/CDA1 family)
LFLGVDSIALRLSKKDLLASMMERSGLLKLTIAFKGTSCTLPILTYHRVVDIRDYPFDEEVVSASVEMFDRQIAFIKQNFNCLTFANLKNALDRNASLPGHPLIITFDDGYADNFHNAFPILKRHGVPAAFFVATDYMGTENPFWWEKVVYWMKQGQIPKTVLKDFESRHTSAVGSSPRAGIAPLAGGSASGRVVPLAGAGPPLSPEVIRWLKGLDNTDRLEMLELWEQAYPIDGNIEMILPLNWDQIRTMSESGMEIGSHTVTHPNLSTLSKVALHNELIASKRKIEKEIGQEVICIAYPGGKSTDHNALVHRSAEEAGYLFGLAYEGGDNPLAHL